jgi:lactoylglutathione lyase
MIEQLAHICFFSDDCCRMLDFYENKLGLKIKFTLDDKSGEPFGWYLECGRMTFVEIFDQRRAVAHWGGQVGQLHVGNQFKHLCFEVRHLDAFIERLTSKGVEITNVKTGEDHSKQAWIKDPDGNQIELMEYSPESFQLVGK